MTTWKMPEWMKPYAKHICPGKTIEYIEEMVNDKTAIQINAPRALLAVEITGRVQMITTLYDKKLLRSGRIFAI